MSTSDKETIESLSALSINSSFHMDRDSDINQSGGLILGTCKINLQTIYNINLHGSNVNSPVCSREWVSKGPRQTQALPS